MAPTRCLGTTANVIVLILRTKSWIELGLVLVFRSQAVRARAQSRAGNAIPVTPDNFIRAETDHYFSTTVKNGGFGKFNQIRELTPLDKQFIVRTNRDTLFSLGVLILMRGP